MMDLATSMPVFISFKGCTTDDGETFATATFETEEALEAWHNHPEHRATQRREYEEFYESLWVRVCKVAFGDGVRSWPAAAAWFHYI